MTKSLLYYVFIISISFLYVWTEPEILRVLSVLTGMVFITYSFFHLLDLNRFKKSHVKYNYVAKAFPRYSMIQLIIYFIFGILYLIGYNVFIVSLLAFPFVAINLHSAGREVPFMKTDTDMFDMMFIRRSVIDNIILNILIVVILIVSL